MLIERSVWSANSEFPAHQPWADDAERILTFLQLKVFWTTSCRVCSRASGKVRLLRRALATF
jgi:hypothetical protein